MPHQVNHIHESHEAVIKQKLLRHTVYKKKKPTHNTYVGEQGNQFKRDEVEFVLY